MRIGFQSTQAWQEVVESIKSDLGLHGKAVDLRLYAGLNHAVMEVALGLIRQFPHKKKACFVKNQSPAFEQQMIALAREGVQIRGVDSLSEVDADALFVLQAEDDPLFGLLFDSDSESMKDSKVFRLRVSHANQSFLPLPAELARGDIRLCAVTPRTALVLSNERLKWPNLSADGLVFAEEDLESVRKLKNREYLNPGDVEQFESTSIEGMLAPLKGRPRLYDRAVVSWRDMDGWAFITRLAEKLNLKLPQPGFPSLLETTSLRRWGGLRTMDWLSGYGFDDEMIRGTVIIDHSLLSKDLSAAINTVRSEILKIQFGV